MYSDSKELRQVYCIHSGVCAQAVCCLFNPLSLAQQCIPVMQDVQLPVKAPSELASQLPAGSEAATGPLDNTEAAGALQVGKQRKWRIRWSRIQPPAPSAGGVSDL